MGKYFKDLEYSLLEQKEVYKGKRIAVEQLLYFNEKEQKEIYREHVLAGDAIAILAITENQEVIMVQEPRTPIGKVILGLPAGMIEPGEKVEEGAIRELEEETGYRANSMKKIREFYPSVGYSNEKLTIYLAKNLVKTKRHLDETEDITVCLIPLEEVKQMLEDNEIITASATIALLYYFLYEEPKDRK